MGTAGRPRRRTRRIGPGLAVVAAVGLAASCVTNPGEFTATIGPGSFIELVDEAGQPNPESFLDIGNPACNDGADNDLDGAVDTGADPQCDSAGDANERLDGVQAYVPTTLPFQVEPDGHFTVQPTDLEILPVEHCVPGTAGEVWCLAVTLRGAGPERQGSINGSHVELPIPITLKFDAVVGFPGFDPACASDYIDAPFSGDNYDEATGQVTVRVENQRVLALTNCGDWTEVLNQVLGLPTVGQSTLELTLLDADGDPIDQA